MFATVALCAPALGLRIDDGTGWGSWESSLMPLPKDCSRASSLSSSSRGRFSPTTGECPAVSAVSWFPASSYPIDSKELSERGCVMEKQQTHLVGLDVKAIVLAVNIEIVFRHFCGKLSRPVSWLKVCLFSEYDSVTGWCIDEQGVRCNRIEVRMLLQP